jgi:hypothetical protein
MLPLAFVTAAQYTVKPSVLKTLGCPQGLKEPGMKKNEVSKSSLPRRVLANLGTTTVLGLRCLDILSLNLQAGMLAVFLQTHHSKPTDR